MGQLAETRIGWENEHLATFLLSRISFVANPITVADDIGSDFFCTLFESRSQNATEQLFPKNSFAIQVKSTESPFAATNKIQYLHELELPFFIGVVDQQYLRLRIYSGEYLPILFCEHGVPCKLKLSPVSATEFKTKNYCEVKKDKKLTLLYALLRLPFIMQISAKDSRKEILGKAQRLGKLCSRMHKNISARVSKEYIFRLDKPDSALTLAGSGSATTFRQNFYLRLTEAFYNFDWIYRNQRRNFRMEEFRVYEKCYSDLVSAGIGIPPILQERYNELKQLLKAANISSCGSDAT